MPQSENKHRLVGAYLLYLISANRNAELLHELSLLSQEVVMEDKYLRFIVGVHDCLMNGEYDRLMFAKVTIIEILL